MNIEETNIDKKQNSENVAKVWVIPPVIAFIPSSGLTAQTVPLN
jgi:hypothetical protein